LILQGRHCASFVFVTNPARSSTFKCFVTAGRLISFKNGFARSETLASPSDNRANIARRVGSASAANV
jgi:hypothetical protein